MSTALVKLTEERINNNSQLQAFVEEARKIANVIFPENLQFTDPSLSYAVRKVTVDQSNEYHVYKDKQSGNYLLHISKIKEFVSAINIKWTNSVLEERKYDEKGQVTYVRVKVYGELKWIDGSIKETVAAGTYDYFSDKYNFSSEAQINKRRYKADQLAETNAKYRAVRDLFPELPTQFTPKQLLQPFLLPYIVEDQDQLLKGLPPEKQQQIREERARKRMGLLNTIYPQGKQVEEAQVITQPSNSESMNQVSDAQVIEEKPMFTPEEKAKMDAATYRDAPQKERTEKLVTLYKLKGIRNKNNSEITAQQVEKASIDKQIEAIEKLLLTPDVVEELP